MKTRTLSMQPMIVGLAILLGIFPLAWPQETPSFKVEVDLVNILATVRDKQGRLVNSLTKEDFLLEEEGQPQEIEYFSSETDLPLTLGLLVDTSMSQSRILEEERQASYQFLADILRPESDLAFVMSFDIEAQLLENLTHSQEQLLAALDSLQVPTRPGRAGVGTVLYDSVFLAVDEILKFESGRKAMIVISDGVDFGSIMDLDQAIEAAQRNDSIIYTVRYYDSEMNMALRGRSGGGGRAGSGGRGGRRGPGGGRGGAPRRPQLPDGKQILERLARETGGSMFEVTEEQSLEEIFQKIEEELRHQYSIGYTPNRESSQKAFRTIRLTTRKGLTVRCREGYYISS
ncbi:MAG: VWA domain-containing protein [Acidobacteria bacterium]|nr:VWA domain-containing protein [Acidobacteriota bacterium]